MFTIGNSATKSGYKSFCGYIDYVAIFNGVKAKEELGKYISDIPYIYSKDISALYYLSDINAVELINSKKITINESVCCFAEDTQRVETDMLTYDTECENDICISSYDQWQGSLAAGLFLGSISSMGIRHRFGLDSKGMPTEAVAREFTKRVSSIPEHMEICLNSTSITPAMTQSYLSALGSAGILGSLGTLFGISSSEVDKFVIAILGAVAVSACSALIATACQKGSDIILNNDNKQPPEQDPEDEKTVVYLKSITFAHNPKDVSSAVYLRRSENQNLSEWELGQTEATDALYIADRHENVTVKATIVFNKPFVGTILAKVVKTDDGILGDLEETKITVDSLTYPAEVEFSLKLARANFHDVKLGSYIDNLTWATRSEKGQIILDTSSHRTWILETEPLEQWNILEKDEARNISIDTLKILDEIRKYDSSKEAGCKLSLTDTDSWLKQMVHFIYDTKKFKYNYEEYHHYSQEYSDGYTFDIRTFEGNYNTEHVEYSSMDSASLLVVMASLLGYEVQMTYLWSCDYNELLLSVDYEKGDVFKNQDEVSFVNIFASGDRVKKDIFLTHRYYLPYIEQLIPIIYDANVTICNDENSTCIYLYALPFTSSEYANEDMCSTFSSSTYRESVVLPGSSCYYNKKQISLVLRPQEKIQIQPIHAITKKENLFAVSGVRDANTLFKKSIGINPTEKVLCHRISCSYIEKVLVSCANTLVWESVKMKSVKIALEALLQAVLGINDGYRTDEHKDYDINIYSICNSLVTKITQGLTYETQHEVKYLSYLNALLYHLTHNSYYNQKGGYKLGNSAVHTHLDTDKHWEFIYPYREAAIRTISWKKIFSDEQGYSVEDYQGDQQMNYARLKLYGSDSLRMTQMKIIWDVFRDITPCYPLVKKTTGGLPIDYNLLSSDNNYVPLEDYRGTYEIYSNQDFILRIIVE